MDSACQLRSFLMYLIFVFIFSLPPSLFKVLVIEDSQNMVAQLHSPFNQNLESAVRTALLQLPESFSEVNQTEEREYTKNNDKKNKRKERKTLHFLLLLIFLQKDLFVKIVTISYLGDLRLVVGEHPRKVIKFSAR